MFITLSQLQNKIKQTIEQNIRAQWVLCDISDLKVNGAGHCYLELVEKSEGRGAIPKAKATAIIWKTNYQMIGSFFHQKTGIALSAGMKVMLLVEVNYHELYGMSLVVRDIDPTYSLGDIERLRRETIARLQADGIFDMNRELELPEIINSVAVISSATAAGYDDFVNHLNSNPYDYTFKVKLYEAVVQGEGAENSIIAALMRINEEQTPPEAVVLIRGGGSQSDLSCFNNYLLCSYIAQFPIPIITGIGHNKDQSVADMVAHTALKTPTAVANFLIDTKREAEDQLDIFYKVLTDALSYHLTNERKRIDTLATTLRMATVERTATEKMKLERLFSTLENNCRNNLRNETHKLSLYERKI
ncbi:MAG: exodeoxyribonuclease VII large subunit, partial [Rikenellaceae bacterium]